MYESSLSQNTLRGMFETFYDFHRRTFVRYTRKIVNFKQSSENVCPPMYQLVQFWSTMYAATNRLERRKVSNGWYIGFFTVQRSENVRLLVIYIFYTADMLLALRHRKTSDFWCTLFYQTKPACFDLCILMCIVSIGFCR